jgi:hypothetical protein
MFQNFWSRLVQSAPQVGSQSFCVASSGDTAHVKPLAFSALPKVGHGAPATGFANATRSMLTTLVTAIAAQASDFANFTFYTVSAG